MRAPFLLVVIAILGCGASHGAGADSKSANYAITRSAQNVAHYRGCPVFTAGDWYNAPIFGSKPDARSTLYIQSMEENGDTGGFVVYAVDPPAYRINLASKTTTRYPVRSVRWHQNEFPGTVPWRPDFFVEPESDAHAIVLDADSCKLTEFYQLQVRGNDLFAYSGWTWDLHKPLINPPGNQPSSTASGLPLFAGLLKGDEIESGGPIDHALNFAPPEGSISKLDFVSPASSTGGCEGCAEPRWPVPYGAHLRLRADFELDCGSPCPQAQRIAQALKTYGAFISDTGSRGTGNQLYVAADAQGRDPWNSDDLKNLEQIHISDMEVLPVGTRMRKS